MAIRPIITAPNPWLKQVSQPVERVDDETRQLMDNMLETMHAAPGIGLAAIQVGVAKCVIVMDLSKDKTKPEPLFFVNPKLIWTSDKTEINEEGCLSLPEFYEEVERPHEAKFEYLDYDGKAQALKAEGLLAMCLQHEMDHLEGILFIDHLSRLKRTMILKKLAKTQKLKESA
jgi:peptide deformylase